MKVCFLIDDDLDDQEIFSIALKDADPLIDCVFANDGAHALQKLSNDDFTPDYIFIDMNMPRMNGMQCLEEIKKNERIKNIPVYMYSTSADARTITETKNLGAKEFIIKPSSIPALTEKLNSILKN